MSKYHPYKVDQLVTSSISKLEFVFTINNGDCDAKWSMPFCLSTRMDNLHGMNQIKYLLRPIIMIITIIKMKNETRT